MPHRSRRTPSPIERSPAVACWAFLTESSINERVGPQRSPTAPSRQGPRQGAGRPLGPRLVKKRPTVAAEGSAGRSTGRGPDCSLNFRRERRMSEKDPEPRPGMTLLRWTLPVAGIVVLGLVAAVVVLFVRGGSATAEPAAAASAPRTLGRVRRSRHGSDRPAHRLGRGDRARPDQRLRRRRRREGWTDGDSATPGRSERARTARRHRDGPPRARRSRCVVPRDTGAPHLSGLAGAPS